MLSNSLGWSIWPSSRSRASVHQGWQWIQCLGPSSPQQQDSSCTSMSALSCISCSQGQISFQVFLKRNIDELSISSFIQRMAGYIRIAQTFIVRSRINRLNPQIEKVCQRKKTSVLFLCCSQKPKLSKIGPWQSLDGRLPGNCLWCWYGFE